MKTEKLVTIAVAMAVALYAQSSVGQQTDRNQQQQQQRRQSTKDPASTAIPAAHEHISLSKLKGADVRSNTGEDLGELEDLLIDPKTGKVTFAIVGKGGVLGLGEKRRPIPWEEVTVNSEKQLTVNVSKEKLQTAPTVDTQYSEMDSPAFVVTIYEFYDVEPPAVGAPGGPTRGTGRESTTPPR